MVKKFVACLGFILGLSAFAAGAGERPPVELLLSGGTLYSLAERSYRSLRLPDGWNVLAGAYSPDVRELALLLVGKGIPPKSKRKSPRMKTKPAAMLPEGPLNTALRPWQDSTRLVIMDRRTGTVSRSWSLPDAGAATEWTIVWTSASALSAIGNVPGAQADKSQIIFGFDEARHLALKPQVATKPAAPPAEGVGCSLTLAETLVHEKTERFIREAGRCAAPPEASDFYRLVRENKRAGKDRILWEYRVAVDTATCSEPTACYAGGDVQFLWAGERRFLVWDGDLYAVQETQDGADVKLLTQLLPQYSHPWAIASGDTRLASLDIVSKVAYQPVTSALSLTHAENPTLYAQNFCPTRSFSASIEVGPYTKQLLTPAGYQVGPVDIGPFKDRASTPVLISVTWTAFHHIVDPVLCKEPYTIAPHTKGIVVSLTESESGALRCRIDTQEDP